MINMLFNKIKSANLDDFGVLYVGYMGVPDYGSFSINTVVDYASEQLDANLSNSIVIDELVQLLILDNDASKAEVEGLLLKVIEKLNLNVNISFRKWLLFALEDRIANLSSDPVYALIELSEFWIKWGQTIDYPHFIQGVNEDGSVSEYYSLSNCNYLLNKNKAWLETQLISLSQCENAEPFD